MNECVLDVGLERTLCWLKATPCSAGLKSLVPFKPVTHPPIEAPGAFQFNDVIAIQDAEMRISNRADKW